MSAASEAPIVFDDGERYERMMGHWSRRVGEPFLDWIAVPEGSRWLDVGCGSGVFTELLVQRARPALVQGFDPSAGQLAYARRRLPPEAPVRWAEADALQLPVPDASADAAVMALVLFFVPEPARGLAEMLRALRPGGVVAAYHWDMLGGGFPLAAIGTELRRLGMPARLPPSVEASTLEASTALWQQAGLHEVRTRVFEVEHRFEGFDAYWGSAAGSTTLGPILAELSDAQRQDLRAAVGERLQAGSGPLTVRARANAVCGIKP